ncbi:RNA polymerase factor sigma-54 [Parapedomonas caeni]
MALGPRLDLRQSQQLVMTPQLQQAIKLLTLTNLELESFIATEIEKNPLLESGDADGDLATENRPEPDSEGFGDVQGGDSDDFGEPTEISAADAMLRDNPGGDSESPLDVDLGEDVYHHDAAPDRQEASAFDSGDAMLSLNGQGAVTGGGGGEDDMPGLDALLVEDKSLHDHLHDQARLAFTTPDDRLIAAHLIDLIDESGYLSAPLDDIALRLGVTLPAVEAALRIIQTFEPTGVGARSLSECLKLQAREADRLDPAMEMLLNNLELLARGDLNALRRLCGVDAEDMADMIRELRNYNPKPGLEFGGERVQTVVPDIFVRKTPVGSWGVELNTATLPRVLVSRSYYTELTSRTSNRAERVFLSECLQSANWLVKALDQRARTILKVAAELVRQQEDFFEQGVRHLKPLNLKNIADVIGMHESTVSRVTANKFLSCQRGVFELKYFFTSAIQSADGGDAHSAESVKQRIKELIDAEQPSDVLSDDKLVEILVAEKFDIARRTVAKYRESMKIPSSVQRRRLKMLEAGQRLAAR